MRNHATAGEPAGSKRDGVRSWFLRVAIPLLLLTAAAMKTRRVTEILASDGLLSSLALLLVVIGFEAAIAVYILMAPQWRSVTELKKGELKKGTQLRELKKGTQLILDRDRVSWLRCVNATSTSNLPARRLLSRFESCCCSVDAVREAGRL